MISILTQERLLGAALGTVLASVVVFEQRKTIYKSISENQSRFSPQSQIIQYIGRTSPLLLWAFQFLSVSQFLFDTFEALEPGEYKRRFLNMNFDGGILETTVYIPKKESSIEFAHLWNKAVDQAFGPLIKVLGSRGW